MVGPHRQAFSADEAEVVVLGSRGMQTRHDPWLKNALVDQVCWRTYQHPRAVEEHGTSVEGLELATEFLEAERASEEQEAAKELFHQQVYGMVGERAEGLFGLSSLFLCSRGLSLTAVLLEAVEGEELCLPSSLQVKAWLGQFH